MKTAITIVSVIGGLAIGIRLLKKFKPEWAAKLASLIVGA